MIQVKCKVGGKTAFSWRGLSNREAGCLERLQSSLRRTQASSCQEQHRYGWSRQRAGKRTGWSLEMSSSSDHLVQRNSVGFTRQSRHGSKRGDETLGAWLAVIPAQGRKLSTFSCLQQCPFYAGKSHKKMESVTEMPKMFTLDKRLPRFSGCERWRCLRLSLNRQVSLPVKNIL